MAPETGTVYVRLLDEGTDVMRPVLAVAVAPGRYRLIEPVGCELSDETWEFPPNSLVRGEFRRGSEGLFVVAVERIDETA